MYCVGRQASTIRANSFIPEGRCPVTSRHCFHPHMRTHQPINIEGQFHF